MEGRCKQRLYRFTGQDGTIYEYPSEYFRQRPAIGDVLMQAYRTEGFVYEIVFDYLTHPGSDTMAMSTPERN